jgi:hypothetical protein
VIQIPPKKTGYVIDRILGRCESCGAVPSLVLEVFKKGVKNCPEGVHTKYEFHHRMEPMMLCAGCIDNLGDFKGLGEKGERIMVTLHRTNGQLFKFTVVEC